MCKNSVRWLYRLDRNFTWDSRHAIPEDLIFLDRTGAVRLLRGLVWRATRWKRSTLGSCEGVADLLAPRDGS